MTTQSYERNVCCGMANHSPQPAALRRRVAWLLLLAWAGGCGHHISGDVPSSTPSAPVNQVASRPTTGQTTPNPPATQSAPLTGAYAGYFWVRPEADSARLKKEIAALQLGDTYAEVVRRLGKPDSEFLGGAKSLLPRLHRHWCIKYQFARFRQNTVTEGDDQAVGLWFDARGRLELISSDHCPGVERRETADAMDDQPMPQWWRYYRTPTTFPIK